MMPPAVIKRFFNIFTNKSPSSVGDGTDRMNWHEDFIVELVKVMRPQLYVELGLYQCNLFNRIIPYADSLIGVDIDKEVENYMIKGPKTEFYHQSTDDFAEYLKNSPRSIDFLFIDADHSKEAVERDFKNFFPFVKPHGLILFHDTHPGDDSFKVSNYCGDGYRAIEKFSKSNDEYEMMTIPVHPGLTLCRKRKCQLRYEEERGN